MMRVASIIASRADYKSAAELFASKIDDEIEPSKKSYDLVFDGKYSMLGRLNPPMNSKPISPELVQPHRLGGRLSISIDKRRLKIWAASLLMLLAVIGFIYLEIRTSLLHS